MVYEEVWCGIFLNEQDAWNSYSVGPCVPQFMKKMKFWQVVYKLIPEVTGECSLKQILFDLLSLPTKWAFVEFA